MISLLRGNLNCPLFSVKTLGVCQAVDQPALSLLPFAKGPCAFSERVVKAKKETRKKNVLGKFPFIGKYMFSMNVNPLVYATYKIKE